MIMGGVNRGEMIIMKWEHDLGAGEKHEWKEESAWFTPGTFPASSCLGTFLTFALIWNGSPDALISGVSGTLDVCCG